MKKIIAGVVVAAAAIIATPVAANAAGYVPASLVTESGAVVPGGTDTVAFAAGAFVGGETVHITITGEGVVALGALPVETESENKTASSDGSLAVTATLPAGAEGTYELTATGATSGNVATEALTVVPADASGAAATSATSSSSSLAFTGSTVPMLLIWAAGGAIVLGGALIGVRTAVRRQRRA